MWRAGTLKVTDKIRSAYKSEWHSVDEVRRDLEEGADNEQPLRVAEWLLELIVGNSINLMSATASRYLESSCTVKSVNVVRDIESPIPRCGEKSQDHFFEHHSSNLPALWHSSVDGKREKIASSKCLESSDPGHAKWP
jgi:hypothetical protein